MTGKKSLSCKKWTPKKGVNPKTGRKISSNGPTMKRLINECGDVSPRSKREPSYEPHKWNAKNKIGRYNCYDYAFNRRDTRQQYKTQPGMLSDKYEESPPQFTCNYLQNMVKEDHPHIQKIKFNKKCPPNLYKIALMVDPNPIDGDYHFMRQNSDGKWSHKMGETEVTEFDGSGHLIQAPHKADRKFTNYNYKNFCGYYCV